MSEDTIIGKDLSTILSGMQLVTSGSLKEGDKALV